MKSVQLTAYGKVADVVKLVDVPDVGTPGPDEIIINVEAAGAIFFPVAGQFSFQQFAHAISVADKFSDKAILTPSIQG